MMGEGDRRASERTGARLSVTVHARGHREETETVDVSLRGIFVAAERLKPLQSLISLTVELPTGPIDVTGMVVRLVTPDQGARLGAPAGMGIRFYGLTGSAKDRWTDFIRDAALASGSEPGLVEVKTEVDRLLPEKIAALHAQAKAEGVELSADTTLSGLAPSAAEEHAVFRLGLRSIDELEGFCHAALPSKGIYIRTERRLPAGSPVVVCIVHPVSGDEFHVPARVVSTKRKRSGVAVAFAQVTSRTVESFSAFIEQGLSADDWSASESQYWDELTMTKRSSRREGDEGSGGPDDTVEVDASELRPFGEASGERVRR